VYLARCQIMIKREFAEVYADILSWVREFKRRWGAYLLLFLLPNIIIMKLLLPIYVRLIKAILGLTDIPYISTQYLPYLFKNPIVLAALLLVSIFLAATFYFEYMLLLNGFKEIKEDKDTPLSIMENSAVSFRRSVIYLFPVAILFVLYNLPFKFMVYGGAVFDKAALAHEVIKGLIREPVLYIICIGLYLLLGLLSVKQIYMYPYIVFYGMSPVSAARKSSKILKGKALFIVFLRMLMAGIFSALMAAIFYHVFWFLQLLFDFLPAIAALFFAVINMSLIEVFGALFSGMMSAIIFMMLLPKECVSTYIVKEQIDHGDSSDRMNHKMMVQKAAGIILVVYIIITAFFSSSYLSNLQMTPPVTISHRGRVSGHGVENTISALQYTVMNAHPDYVEIDIQETKDHKFIVVHDANLKRLCGIDKYTYSMTLKELAGMEVREGSFTAEMPDFDEYLCKADDYGQKLLIEIKTNPYNSPDMTERFLEQYGDDIKSQGHIVQTFDINVVKKIKESDQDIRTGYLLNYAPGYLNSSSDFLSIEKSTLSDSFIMSVKDDGKEVYAWTINRPRDMRRLMFLNVDGIITDNIEELNDIIDDYGEHPHYADRIAMYFNFRL